MAEEAQWLRINERSNALDYLEKTHYFIEEVENDPLAWKWAIIALHGAVYAFAICALEQGNYDNVVKCPNARDPRLISFPEAVQRCQDPQRMGPARVLQLSREQKKSIKTLNKGLRNVFGHFIPTGMSIAKAGLPPVAADCLDIVSHLALHTQTTIHLSDQEKRRIEFLVSDGKRILKDKDEGAA